MRRIVRASAVATLGQLLVPASAYAGDGTSIVPAWLPYVAGLVSLTVSVVLLSEILSLRRLAFGGAISSNVSYVVAAVVCLAGSALAYWTANFLPAVTQDQAVLASNLLVAAAMGLLVLYFAAVRRTLLRFVRDLTRSMDDLEPEALTSQQQARDSRGITRGSLGG